MYKLIILIILICILSYLIHINSCYKETYDNQNNIDNIKDNSVIIPYKILQIFPDINKNKIENSIVIRVQQKK